MLGRVKPQGSLPWGVGVAPVDVGLFRRTTPNPAGPGWRGDPCGFDHLANEPADGFVGVGHSPGAVHGRGVDHRGELGLEDAGRSCLLEGLLEQLAVGIARYHAGSHEGGSPDALEVVVDSHGRLPIGVHPASPGGSRRRRRGRAWRTASPTGGMEGPPMRLAWSGRRGTRGRGWPAARRTSSCSPGADAHGTSLRLLGVAARALRSAASAWPDPAGELPLERSGGLKGARSYSCSTAIGRDFAGGKVGWQRQRAWMEV